MSRRPTASSTPPDIAVTLVPEIIEDLRSQDPAQYGPATLQLLQQIAFADPGDYLTWGPGGVKVKPSDQLTPLQRRLIKGVREDKDGNIILEFCSKDRAIELLGKASGAIVERRELSGKLDVGLMDVLREIDGRTRGLPPKDHG